MTNLDNILKSRDITLLTKVHINKAMVFPVVMYGCERLNLGVEWGIHFSMSDLLDGRKDPYHVESSGMFKNTDCYSALQVTLTYSFMAKCKVCHNEDE